MSEGEREYLRRAAAKVDAEVRFCDMRELDSNGALSHRHDPQKLATALLKLTEAR